MLKRIYILFIAILLIAVLVTGLVSTQVVSSYNDRYNHNILLSATQMIQQDMDGGLAAADASARMLKVFNQPETPLRVTIVDRQGNVLYDNEAISGEMENHLFRPEISYALQHKTVASAIRASSTLHIDMLYLALYNEKQDIVIRTSMALSASQTGLNNILLTIGIVMAAALLLLGVAGTIMTRLIARPLVNLEKAALAMSKGQYDVRVHHLRSQDGEIYSLSRTFNTMADQLQAVVQDLEDKNARLDVIFDSMSDPLLAVSSDTSVTFMNRAAREVFGRDLDPTQAVFPLYLITHSQDTDALVEQAFAKGGPITAESAVQTVKGKIDFHIFTSPIKAETSQGVIMTFHDISEIRKIQKMRSDFVANVSHELRTPLTSIRGFIETLRGDAINNPEVARRFIDIIDIEAERLHQLITDILILSEIEDLREDKERETFNLNAVIDDVAVLLDETASARKVSLVVENGDVPLSVSASKARMKQILINLAENAIKYNYEGGKVFIKADRQTDSRVRLTVRDTGPGIPPEHQERVFERFYRVDSSRSRELGGTGLGLSIVKHIAQLYDGSASVVSRPGEGATFIVDLKI